MTSDSEFDSIRPYCGNEVKTAAMRLSQSPEFLELFSKLLKIDKDFVVKGLQQISTRDQFQVNFFGPAIQSLMQMTTDGVTVEGLELVDKNTSYTFMSNHRDIILDSAILNVLLRGYEAKYTRPAIGSNLLINDWVIDFVKLNSCFVI